MSQPSSASNQCTIHIGTEKTATTTLQAFLALNRSTLADHGILVPSALAEPNHWGLAVAAYDDERRDDLTRTASIETGADLDRFRRAAIAGVKAEMAAAGATRAVFSSEHLQSRLRTDDEVQRLAEVVKEMGFDEATIIVYLRDPVALAASLHSTMVKHGAASVHPPPPTNPYYHRVCDHRATLEQFGAVFGPTRVVPRLFSPDALVGGSIIEDFTTTAGLPAGLTTPPDEMNRGLSAGALAVLCRMNNLLSPPLRVGLRAFFEQASTGAPSRLDAERALAYAEAFASSNQWAAERYFEARDPLFPPGPPPPLRRSTADDDAVALMMAELWVARRRAEGANVDDETLERLAVAKAVLDSGLWDPEHYFATYPALELNGVTPLTHYLRHGGREGRSPSPKFDVPAYLARHPDIADSKTNPLLHHLGLSPSTPKKI